MYRYIRMKLFITYLLIFIAACLSAQSVGDELLLNKVDLSNDKVIFSVLGDTLGTLRIPETALPISSNTITEKLDKSDHVLSFASNYLNVYSDGEFRASLNVKSGAYLQDADKRNKKDIRALKEGSLQKLLQLEPMSYLMKNQENKERSVGLIAQDVREVFPAFVQYVDGEDVLAISYIELIPMLIKAIQEQQNTIQNLKDNQYIMQKEFAVFQLQMAQLAESLISDNTAFRNGVATVAENRN